MENRNYDKTNKNKWWGILYSEEEIDIIMQPIIDKYVNMGDTKTAKEVIAEDISEAFGIPLNVSLSFLTIAHTLYTDDYYTVLISVKDLMKSNLHYSVYNSLDALGIEMTSENARKHVLGEI